MKNFDLEELETLFIFAPSPGDTWGLTFTHLKQRLLEANPEVFIRVEDPRDGNSPGDSFMFFEFTLEGKELEGMAKISPEGVAAQNCTAQQAADFVEWLRTSAIPPGHTITFNTEWGVESEIPDADVPITEKSQLIELFLAHIVETGGLE
ncbi:hypothetical protein AMK09_01090 [Streptomyces sp. CB02488]|uniref:hypothetical protein n=1 Tax=unclassified Streptomyces TaxID=2593676 RepID=UPI00093C9246|nr:MULTISPECIES: hypothetical protein [unclassified Streptomyces]OKK24831.1 hypothetical protein AMK09_01090 [Streptomyces sp. CB02488]